VPGLPFTTGATNQAYCGVPLQPLALPVNVTPVPTETLDDDGLAPIDVLLQGVTTGL
jgi:hypothetical protein